MNTQFHTPSFGDEFVDVQHQSLQSKRMRGLDSSLDEYHSANDESFGHTSIPLINCSPPSGLMPAPANITPPTTTTLAARKQLTATTDPNEPAKPLSPYALFFRDTVSAIKQQNPNCSFQELSRIVASMWEALDPMHKNVYQKKNENARNEYLKQMRVYRQQQLDQQQQHLALANEQLNNHMALQTRPAVFNIARSNSTDAAAATAVPNAVQNNYMNSMATSPQQQQPQQQQQQQQLTSPQTHYLSQQQQTFDIPTQQQQQLYNMNTQQAALVNNATTVAAAAPVLATTPTDPTPQQMQMLTEAGSVQKCTRENCSKRAIINPDWEDEYCSNECVVIHCRNVFNTWVQSNLEARKQ